MPSIQHTQPQPCIPGHAVRLEHRHRHLNPSAAPPHAHELTSSCLLCGAVSPDQQQSISKKGITLRGKPLYLDMQATTPLDPRVVDAMLPFFTENVSQAWQLFTAAPT